MHRLPKLRHQKVASADVWANHFGCALSAYSLAVVVDLGRCAAWRNHYQIVNDKERNMSKTMQPDVTKITIKDNLKLIHDFLSEVILTPRTTMIKWARITNQTPNMKIGYPGQHLASLITGMQGTATGARGEDIVDGTEVKSCSRVDQVDKCKDCGRRVMRNQTNCPQCGSMSIKRNDDSKWLIAVRNEKELDLYLNHIPRMLFLISDYPLFESGDFDTLRFIAYEIWNQSDRAVNFRKLLTDYYRKIYCAHIKSNPSKTPAPKNFWPYSQQFYMCNPIKTFECIIRNANSTTANIKIDHYVKPDVDRSELPSEDMPTNVLNRIECAKLRKSGIPIDSLSAINERMRLVLSLRNTSKAMPHKTAYHRM